MTKSKKKTKIDLLTLALKVCVEKIMTLNEFYKIDLIEIYATDFIKSDFSLFMDYVDKLSEDMKGGE